MRLSGFVDIPYILLSFYVIGGIVLEFFRELNCMLAYTLPWHHASCHGRHLPGKDSWNVSHWIFDYLTIERPNITQKTASLNGYHDGVINKWCCLLQKLLASNA